MKEIDWRTLMALSGGGDPKAMIAMAFRDLADNAQRIGQLNISPDLLSTLIGDDGGERLNRMSVAGGGASGGVAATAAPQPPRGRQNKGK
jgi:hypothetical protein